MAAIDPFSHMWKMFVSRHYVSIPENGKAIRESECHVPSVVFRKIREPQAVVSQEDTGTLAELPPACAVRGCAG